MGGMQMDGGHNGSMPMQHNQNRTNHSEMTTLNYGRSKLGI